MNVSAMSFGSLSHNAIRALNKGAELGGFLHDTGEGAISSYHQEANGDLLWELGTGYFGARDEDGNFDPQRFRDRAADEQIKCVSLKLTGSQARPGRHVAWTQGDRGNRRNSWDSGRQGLYFARHAPRV